jgi:hypothetical protein
MIEIVKIEIMYQIFKSTSNLLTIFYLHLMLHTLTITNYLSQSLQRKDQDIATAIRCVRSTRDQLTELRAHGWQKILHDTYAFCDLHDTTKLEMENTHILIQRGLDTNLELQTSITMKWIVLMKFLIG